MIELTLICGAQLRISGCVDEASLGSVIRVMRFVEKVVPQVAA